MLVYLFFVLELFSQGRAPIATPPEANTSSAEQCRDCHATEYEEWRGSRHALAWTNDFFQFDYRQNKRQWCRNCHIPLEAQQASSDPAVALRSEGVNCIACHVRDGVFYAKTKRAKSPHATVAMPSFGSDDYCAGCHQFNFPIINERDEFVAYTKEPMQDTVGQFRAGPFAKTHTCRDCHANTPGQHRYAGSHDLAMLQRALTFAVCRNGDSITTTLSNVGAGHNVPTGDVHRHLLVKAWRSNAPEKLQQAFYGRRFAPVVGGGKVTIWDSSLPPQTSRAWRFDATRLGAAATEPIHIEVHYLYGSRESYRPPFAEAPLQVVFATKTILAALPLCPSPAANEAPNTR